MTLQTANIVYISYNDGPEYTTFDAFTSKVVQTEANSYNYIFNEPQSNGYITFNAATQKNVKIVTAAITSISYNPPVITWG